MSISDTREAKKYASIAEVAASQCKMYTDEARKAPEYTNLAKEYSESAALSSESAASSAMDAFSYANSSSQNSIDAKRSADEAMSSELIASEAKVSAEQSQQAAASSAEIAAAAVSKTLRVSDTDLPPLPNVEGRANKVLTFDSNGNAVASVPAGGSAEDVLIQLAKPNGASLVGFGDQTIEDVANDVPNKISGELKFSLGGVLYSSKDFIFDESSYSWFYWTGEFPKTIPENSTPGSTGGEGAGAWIGISDEGLRTQLSQNDGANLIGYGDITVASKLDQLKTPFDFGAKGDGITDDTLALQAYIDGVDGDIDLYGKTYLVSKNPALATTYPTEPDLANNGYNFCPCLAVVNKTNKRIFNGTLVSKVFGQSVLSIINSTGIEVNLKIVGFGKFPAIDHPSGYAEKGYSTGGYNTIDGGLLLGPNNSIPTSSYTLGKYNGTSGQFPIYDSSWNPTGAYQSTWGAFGGGNIGSFACGITIQRACKDITVRECTIYGFNEAAIGIGIRFIVSQTGYTDYTIDSDVPRAINILDCYLHDCYTAGVHVCSGYNIVYDGLRVENIGHPDANDATDTDINPGYGVTTSRFPRIRNISCVNNFFFNCKRKSIDFHAGGQIIVDGNFCMRTGVNGIYFEAGYGWDNGYEPYNIIVTNNYITTRALGVVGSGGISMVGNGSAQAESYPYPFLKCNNNYVEIRSANGVGINNGYNNNDYHFEDINICDNTVVYKSDILTPAQFVGIRCNLNTSQSTSLPKQNIKLCRNSIKILTTMGNYEFGTPINIGGQPAAIIATGNTVDMGGFPIGSGAWYMTITPSPITDYYFSGNKILNYIKPSSLRQAEVMFYDNIGFTATGTSVSIAMQWFRGIWTVDAAGLDSLAGAKSVTLASDGVGITQGNPIQQGSISAAMTISSSNIGFTTTTGTTCYIGVKMKPVGIKA